MATIERCPEHSGFESRIENVETNIKEQWEAIKDVQKRPPVWATAVISILTFLLGAAVTYASMAVKIAEMVKKP
jgi:hypothetical protein